MSQRKIDVLIVDDEESVRGILCKVLRRHGYNPVEASNGKEGLELFGKRHPDIVVADVRMPEMGGLDLLRAIKKKSPNTCVAIMTGYGTEEVAIQAIRSGACNYFKKPFNASDFVYAIGALAELVRQRQEQNLDFSLLVREEKTFVLGSDMKQVYPLISELTRTLTQYSYDVESIQVGLLEMITNAIEHGNLKISPSEKQKAIENRSFEDLCRSRSEAPSCRGRKVEVGYTFTTDKVAYTVKDEGNGFDWKEIPDIQDSKNIIRSGGRGIVMTRLLMDDLSYNKKGNMVTIVKRVRAPSPDQV